jgi:Dyp-type peroxidase family
MRLDDIQGNVLVGYKSTHAHFFFAQVTDPGAARAWLGRQLPHVTFNRWQHKPPHTLNIAFTAAGLRALGVPYDRLNGLEAFSSGMAARAEQLGDEPHKADGWQSELCDSHLLITLTAWDQSPLDAAVAQLEQQLAEPANGLGKRHGQPAATLACAREHFGFTDGFSQPSIKHAKTGPRDGEGVLKKLPLLGIRYWRDVALGEFILGYRDEGGEASPSPKAPLGLLATFMVVRKLEQDVLAFRRYLAEQARRLYRDEAWIAAKIVGRWQNGSPLAAHPYEPGPVAGDARKRINRFHYANDPHGLGCPLGAHVRRANPRDALGWEGRLTMRHRILRRGISYGPELPPGATAADGLERGLMFVCYQASIERQFEFIQQQWVRDGNVFGLGNDHDPLIGGSPGSQMVIQGKPPLFLSGIPQFVTARGGDYFLLPGRPGLEALVSGGW